MRLYSLQHFGLLVAGVLNRIHYLQQDSGVVCSR